MFLAAGLVKLPSMIFLSIWQTIYIISKMQHALEKYLRLNTMKSIHKIKKGEITVFILSNTVLSLQQNGEGGTNSIKKIGTNLHR